MKPQPVTGVIFDVFGTLLSIEKPTQPYLRLLNLGASQGRRRSATDLRQLMTNPLTLSGAANLFGIEITDAQMQILDDLLTEELASIKAFPDALDVVSALDDATVRVGICSNLALPYGAPIMHLFPQIECHALSFEHGIMKPDPLLYQIACRQLGIAPGNYFTGDGGRVVMIGDSRKCDRDGPRLAGITGFHLDRSGKGGIDNLAQFAQSIVESNSHSA
ncbi:HAD family hydrolase [Pseudomonas sp. S2_H01]